MTHNQKSQIASYLDTQPEITDIKLLRPTTGNHGYQATLTHSQTEQISSYFDPQLTTTDSKLLKSTTRNHIHQTTLTQIASYSNPQQETNRSNLFDPQPETTDIKLLSPTTRNPDIKPCRPTARNNRYHATLIHNHTPLISSYLDPQPKSINRSESADIKQL